MRRGEEEAAGAQGLERSPSEAPLKKQCKSEYDQLKGDVMQFLIQAEWVQQEAEKQDIKVTDKEVENRFDEQKKRAFPKRRRRYQKFLKTSGHDRGGHPLPLEARDAPAEAHPEGHREGGEGHRQGESSDYYERTRSASPSPSGATSNVVLTKTKAKADQAKAALDGGEDFKAVSKKYSIDEASKPQGGKLPDVAKGQQEKAFDDAIFSAKKGELEGPIKTQFGYYVFEVTKVTPASQQSLEQAKETIKNLLASQRQQKALDKFIKDFRKRYKEQTVCADDFAVAECKNAPKAKTDTGAASRRHARRASPQPAPHAAGAAAGAAGAAAAAARPSRRRQPVTPERGPSSRPRSRGSTRSPGGCAASARGTASRTSARSCRTRSRRPTSWPTPPTPATTRSCSTSSATCSSRSTSSRCCSRSAARATWRPWPTTAARS